MTSFILILIIIIFDIYLIWNYAKEYFRYNNIRKNGVGVSGEIVEYQIEEKNNAKLYFPIIKYKTVFGEPFTEKLNQGFTYEKQINQEKNITIKYLPNNPKYFILDETSPEKGLIIMIIYTFITSVFAIFFLIRNEDNLLVKFKNLLNL